MRCIPSVFCYIIFLCPAYINYFITHVTLQGFAISNTEFCIYSNLEVEQVHQVLIVQSCYGLVLSYLRLSVSAEVGLASSVTSASVGKWQILDAVSSTEEMVKGSARLGVPTK